MKPQLKAHCGDCLSEYLGAGFQSCNFANSYNKETEGQQMMILFYSFDRASWHRQAYAGVNGLKTSSPSALKSLTFLVATVKPCTFAVAASMASS